MAAETTLNEGKEKGRQMTFVTCSCGVELLYRRLPEGPDMHWNKACVAQCKRLQMGDDGKARCTEIERLVDEDYTEWRRQLNALRRKARSRD
jgi:hypothetical protein